MIPRRSKLKRSTKPIARSRIKPTTKASARSALIRECDSLCSKLVIARDGRCVRCGGTEKLMSCHILPKGKYTKLRFDLYNLMAMDFKCHLGNGGWHKDPAGSMVWFNAMYPGRYDRLLVMEGCATKPDLKLLVICLRSEVAATANERERI